MTMPTLTERAHDGSMGDPALPERSRRRRFDADYKLTILADYDRMSGSVRAPEVFVHRFRSNPYSDSGVFVQRGVGGGLGMA